MNAKVLADKNAAKSVGKSVERDIVINGTHIHIKSVFNGEIPLEKALRRIAVRKLSAKKKV